MITLRKFLLDTNILNMIADDKIDLSKLHPSNVIFTHIQKDELGNTKNPERRLKLLNSFREIKAVEIPTSAAVWGVSNWGQALLADSEIALKHNEMLKRLQELDRNGSKKPKDPANQPRDILLVITAIKNELTFVTTDPQLTIVSKENNCDVFSLEEFQDYLLKL